VPRDLVAAIPAGLRAALREAIVSADLDRVHELCDRVAAADAATATVLRELAERYEYEALLALLGDEESDEAS
jgi:DNA polymerase III gamma/tau subunit